MQNILLRFLNRSHNVHNDDIGIFLVPESKESPSVEIVAWKVIKNCGYNYFHPFEYPLTNFISAFDKHGNYTPLLEALPGDRFEVKSTPEGTKILKIGNDECETDIQLINNDENGDISVELRKGEKLVSLVEDVALGQKATFGSKFTFWITMEENISEGSPLSSFAIENAQQISFNLIKKADIVKRGGGLGPKATKTTFHLENVVPL